jgi:biopolymer transport protein TolQ
MNAVAQEEESMLADAGTMPGPVGLFLQASPIVKAVMILLILASVVCWAVILDKVVRVMRVNRLATAFRSAVVNAPMMGLQAADGVGAAILTAGAKAWREDDASESRAERRERIERAMRMAMGEEIKKLENGLIFLATVGSTAPFVGLFGTVWGIINSFTAIAASKDTSLAVVAPGIAEALSATALGLVAAIPAVMAYNKLASAIGGIAYRFNVSIAELGDGFSRRRASA